MSKLRPRRINGFKRTSYRMMKVHHPIPTYLRSVLSLTVNFASTPKLYNSLMKEVVDNEKIDDLQFSNKVICQETGTRNRYFLMQEPT